MTKDEALMNVLNISDVFSKRSLVDKLKHMITEGNSYSFNRTHEDPGHIDMYCNTDDSDIKVYDVVKWKPQQPKQGINISNTRFKKLLEQNEAQTKALQN